MNFSLEFFLTTLPFVGAFFSGLRADITILYWILKIYA